MSDTPQGLVAGVRAELARRRLPRRWVWALAAVGAVLLALAARALFFGADTGPQYATFDLEKRDLLVTVSATGNLQPTNQVEVGSETSGIITQVYVDNNDLVTAGQVLAVVDTERLRASLRQAEATLASARAQLATNEATLAESAAQLQRLEEVRQLSGGQVPSRAEFDVGRADYRRALAQVDSASASVKQADAQVFSARISLERATIFAPVTGIVLSRKVDPGQTVAAQFQTPELFVIAEDLSTMRLDVEVDEADITRVKAGQAARFTIDAFPGRSFPARVERVDVGATKSSDGGTGTSGSGDVVSYVARLSVANPDGLLRPGMTATASITAQTYRSAFVVPLAAMRFAPARPSAGKALSVGPPDLGDQQRQQARIGAGSTQTIHVLGADGKLKALTVQIVAVSADRAAVTGKGLRPGQKIVLGLLEAAKP
ncbi:efflux RND transporter periplasmic adaptor subunit [Erythrobacter sp. NE805]|uniref:efflux RND transporter periplasmic adaptor subunit n=1 Tax=Erythrobacter sp. NE805 TaxID=3389875 RepID=UPI00396AFB11